MLDKISNFFWPVSYKKIAELFDKEQYEGFLILTANYSDQIRTVLANEDNKTLPSDSLIAKAVRHPASLTWLLDNGAKLFSTKNGDWATVLITPIVVSERSFEQKNLGNLDTSFKILVNHKRTTFEDKSLAVEYIIDNIRAHTTHGNNSVDSTQYISFLHARYKIILDSMTAEEQIQLRENHKKREHN